MPTSCIANPPIRFRFSSDTAFYNSLDKAKGTGKGEHRDLCDQANRQSRPVLSSQAASNGGREEPVSATLEPVSSECVTPPASVNEVAATLEPVSSECATPPASVNEVADEV